jgi:hypothetical protein
MVAVAAADLTQPRAAVTLAGATLREHEAVTEKFWAGVRFIFAFTSA